jgi:hypothetical protein
MPASSTRPIEVAYAGRRAPTVRLIAMSLRTDTRCT